MGAYMVAGPHGSMLDEVAELTRAESIRRLAAAVAWSAGLLAPGITVTPSEPSRPRWVPRNRNRQSCGAPQTQMAWYWLSDVQFTLQLGDDLEVATLEWPARWTPTDAVACPDPAVSPGCHDGLYLGKPVAVGHGVRLREGLHMIVRPGREGWLVQAALSPTLGLEVFNKRKHDFISAALLGPMPNVFLAPELRSRVYEDLAAGDAEDGDIEATSPPAKKSARIVPDPQGQNTPNGPEAPTSQRPEGQVNGSATLGSQGRSEYLLKVARSPEGTGRKLEDQADWELELKIGRAAEKARAEAEAEVPSSRTAARWNRFVGADEVMAELVFSAFSERADRSTRGSGSLVAALARILERAAELALRTMARGGAATTSVVSGVDRGTTLARIEQSARVCFLGFRGLARSLRGRADLRDLDPGWRGILCPVQTPESADVGLVRFAAVGLRANAENEQAFLRRLNPRQDPGQWYDLSASAALIPFINHDDPARASIGSKNLKQALPVSGREPPLVATGWERVFGLVEGAATAPDAGEVVDVGDDTVELWVRDAPVRVAFGAPWLQRSGADNTWMLDVKVGDRVVKGQILAHAPDVVVHSGQDAELCLGVNALVALTPWHGLNFEDAIVVSDAFAARMTSTHIVRVDEPIEHGDDVRHVAAMTRGVGGHIEAGETLLRVDDWKNHTRSVTSPVGGVFLGSMVDAQRSLASALVQVRRPLVVGDKLSNRHQGKGLVSRIIPAAQMPALPDGKRIEVILNPLGVLRRLNIGQLWEMHAGLRAVLSGAGQQVVGRKLADPAALRDELEGLGAPLGRLPLRVPQWRDGELLPMDEWELLGGPDGVVVGPQYMLKLDHLASSKLSVRGADPVRSPVSAQPSQTAHYRCGVRVGAAQRMGEMEVWALEAQGASRVLDDALNHRCAPSPEELDLPRASLRSIQAHLAVAGLDLGTHAGQRQSLRWTHRDTIDVILTRWLQDDLPELPEWRTAAAWPEPTIKPPRLQDLKTLVEIGDMPDLTQASAWRAVHPLYRSDWHGARGTLDAEEVRYAIPLPEPIPHPWQRSKGPVLPALTCVPVLPPAYRIPGLSQIDRQYRELAIALTACEQARSNGEEDPAQHHWLTVRKIVQIILGVPPEPDRESILGRISGKRGLLRRFLLGQSVIHSGRSVIVPDLSLAPSQVGVPAAMLPGLGAGRADSDDPYRDVVIINRQPSLHPYNLVALRATTVTDDAIHLHPLVVGGLAGDFDGDTVAIHRPILPDARREAWELLRPAANLRSSASGGVLAKMDLDIALGLRLTSKGVTGRQGLSKMSALPAEDIATSSPADLASSAIDTEPDPDQALIRLGQLEQAGWEAATGWSIGALDLLAHGRDGHFAEAIAAGAGGKDSGIAQLLDRRGKVAGGYVGTPIVDVQGRFLTGLANDDYFATAPGALASLAEKKLMSPHAGALTKTLVEIADPVVMADCACDVPDALRSPLTCRATTGVCPACFGPDPGTGAPVPPGRRVGVLCATLIGERSTQLSMKVFHGGGGAGELGGGIAELKAIFGEGKAAIFGEEKGQGLRLTQYLEHAGDLSDPAHRILLLRPAIDRAVELLGGRVAPVHVAVILRQLVESFLARDSLHVPWPGYQAFITGAQRRGRTWFEAATSRGAVTWLEADPGEGRGSFRTKLTTGHVK